MSKKAGLRNGFFSLLAFFLLLPPSTALAHTGGDHWHCPCCEEDGRAPTPTGSSVNPCNPYLFGGSAISITEGNLREQYRVSTLRSAFGVTLDFTLTYNSYNADGSRTSEDTFMGWGWTHSYNAYLFSQFDDMFRMDGDGRITKYIRRPDGTFVSTPGYFETLVRNPDGTFTLTRKDKTIWHFVLVPDSPFEGIFSLASIVDRNNNTSTLAYTNGYLTRITDTYGRSLRLTYDSNNRLDTITDPLGRATTLAYDSTSMHLIQISDPEGNSVQYIYNAQEQITNKVDKDGRRFSYIYVDGKPVAIRDGAGATLFELDNPEGWATDFEARERERMREYIPTTTSQTDGRGNVWRYDYDKHGYVTKVIAPDGARTVYTYDPATLRVESTTDGNGHTTSYEYDALGNRTKITNALGHMTVVEYEPVFSQMIRMIDANGRITRYEYDARGNRIREIDPLGQVREWTYDEHGNVLSEKDKRGSITTHEYDDFGNRKKTTLDALGLRIVTEFEYDIIGNLRFRTDANGHTTSFRYDGLDRLVRETDPLGGVTVTSYDGEGNRTGVIDCNRNSTFFEYDLRRRLVKIRDALKQESNQTYDGSNNRVSFTDKNRHTTEFGYDLQNRLNRITDALGNVSTRSYDPVGNVLSETDANGHTTTYEYDELNRRITRTDAVKCVTLIEYDRVGLPGCPACTGPTRGSSLVTMQTDGNGKVTYFKYDGLDRLIIEIRKEGDKADVIDGSDAVTRYTYDVNGNRLAIALRITAKEDNTSTFEYDALNRRTKEANPAGDVTEFRYDGEGNLITIIAPNGNITTNNYDDNDRLIRVVDQEGLVTEYAYDCVGNRLSETDGNGNGRVFRYDALYRLVEVLDALKEPTRYRYDPVGNLLHVIDREGNETSHQYDDINRRIRTVDALRNVTRFEYDGVGNLRKIIDAKEPPGTTEYQYDGVNRLIEEIYPDPKPNTRRFTYDCVGNLLTRTDQKGQITNYIYNDLYFLLRGDYPKSADDNMTYDLAGRVLTAERDGWLVEFTYDGADRVTQATQDGKTINYVYDIPGRTRGITYPDGRAITEQMDFRDRKTRVDDGPSPPIVQYTYDPGNRVRSRAYRNGTVANYEYNRNDWILSLEHSLGAARIVGFAHEHDREGNKNFEEKRHDLGHSEAYQYDRIYRLIDFKVGELVGSKIPVPLTQTAYDLDQVGNWRRKVTNGVPEIRTHNLVNEITSIAGVPIIHDDNGNLEQDEQHIYSHDEENRLVRVMRASDGIVLGQYRYDALGRRVGKVAKIADERVETRYFYDGQQIIEEQDTDGATKATYVYGNYIDEVLTMDRDAQHFYYHQNTLFSVFALTNTAGAIAEAYQYDAYGKVTVFRGPGPDGIWFTGDEPRAPFSSIGNPYTYTGRELDSETSLLHYRARTYDPVQGRFKQRDPLEYVDGMNLYEYVTSLPTFATDPLGLEIVSQEIDVGMRFPTFEPPWTGNPRYKFRATSIITVDFRVDNDKCTVELVKCTEKGLTQGGVPLGKDIAIGYTTRVECDVDSSWSEPCGQAKDCCCEDKKGQSRVAEKRRQCLKARVQRYKTLGVALSTTWLSSTRFLTQCTQCSCKCTGNFLQMECQ